MADFLEPLLPIVNSEVGMSASELTKAVEESLLRVQILEDVLRGERHVDDFNDLLRSEDWDPDAYWQQADTNVEAFIRAGIVPESLELLDSGLVIPRH